MPYTLHKAPFDTLPNNHRLGVDSTPSHRGLYGGTKPRVWYKPGKMHRKKIISPCVLVKCGCCDQRVEISFDEESLSLEINGVEACNEDWRDILLPLLGFARDPAGMWVDVRTQDIQSQRAAAHNE